MLARGNLTTGLRNPSAALLGRLRNIAAEAGGSTPAPCGSDAAEIFILENDVDQVAADALRRAPLDVQRQVVERGPGLKGSIGEGPNHSNFSDDSSVNIVSEFGKINFKFC